MGRFEESKVRRGQPDNAGQFASKHGVVTAGAAASLRDQALIDAGADPEVNGWQAILHPDEGPNADELRKVRPGESTGQRNARMVTLRMAQADAEEAASCGWPVDDGSVRAALDSYPEPPASAIGMPTGRIAQTRASMFVADQIVRNRPPATPAPVTEPAERRGLGRLLSRR